MPRRIASAAQAPGALLWQTLREFVGDNCPQMAAAISFYAIFSLPPILLLLIMAIGPFLDRETVVRVLEQEVGRLVGPDGAAQVLVLVENVVHPGEGGVLAAVLGIGAALFGATAAFAQLQGALNTAWQVGPDPERGDVVNFVVKRVLSFAMILTIGLLLVASLIFSTFLGAFADALQAIAPALPSGAILRVLDISISFAAASLLFASMYRFLPDARVEWRSALFGGAVTAAFFATGKAAIGYYLGQTAAGSAFGAAGSFAMVLIWIYYSSMVLLWGAEFTQVWMRRRGRPIEPEPGAVRIFRSEERYEPDETVPPVEGAKE